MIYSFEVNKHITLFNGQLLARAGQKYTEINIAKNTEEDLHKFLKMSDLVNKKHSTRARLEQIYRLYLFSIWFVYNLLKKCIAVLT